MLAAKYLNDRVVGRSVEIRAILAAYLADDNVCMIGPPGTGKSFLARAFADLLPPEQGVEPFFSTLMGRTTNAGQLFGPLDIPSLTASPSVYKRQTRGRLPNARVAFLDEVFKAPAPVRDLLLTLINEGLYDNGHGMEKVPLRFVIGASNETPTTTGDEDSGAFADRFGVWVLCEYLHDALPDQATELALAMIAGTRSQVDPGAAGRELAQVYGGSRDQIHNPTRTLTPQGKAFLTRDMATFLVQLSRDRSVKDLLANADLPDISDRSMVKASRLACALAVLDGCLEGVEPRHIVEALAYMTNRGEVRFSPHLKRLWAAAKALVPDDGSRDFAGFLVKVIKAFHHSRADDSLDLSQLAKVPETLASHFAASNVEVLSEVGRIFAGTPMEAPTKGASFLNIIDKFLGRRPGTAIREIQDRGR